MFFFLASTVGRLSVPSHALVLIALLGSVLLVTRFRRAGRRVLLGCLIVFIVVGAWPVGGALLYVLENRFPAWSGTTAPNGIVVLGGPIPIQASLLRGHPVVRSGAERLTEIPELARRFPNARIVFSGGNPSLAGGPPEAQFAVPLLRSFGIARERLIAEDRSRNTAENAAFTMVLIKPAPGERWLLVTSAAHMPRAIGAFRKAGFPVEAYPVDWLGGRGPSWRWLLPSLSFPAGWGAFDAAAKEWIGLGAYWLAGYSSELFPGPVVNHAAAGPADRRL
jgi:uncharacterized SAM-binding protein YcdF (DUF218 family)